MVILNALYIAGNASKAQRRRIDFMKPSIITPIVLAILSILTMDQFARAGDTDIAGQTDREMRHCRDQIRQVLREQGSQVLSAEALRLLEAEWEKPFAVGGKQGGKNGIPLDTGTIPTDLGAGWELFVQGDRIRAIAEFTQGDVHSGLAQKIAVIVLITPGEGEGRRLTIDVWPLARRVDCKDPKEFMPSDETLRKAGFPGR
jgi:hypothetical protein